MTGPFANRLFRIAFVAAGVYNLAFGFWAALWPLALFEWFEIPPPRYSQIWSCLGMVVGLYGLLYLHAAWRLETAWPIIAVGLLGKLLGPIGMATSFGDDWPRRVGVLCVYNDLIWWLPFGLFVVHGTWVGRRLVAFAPWLCIVLHVSAMAAMAIYLRPGLLMEPDVARRAHYVAEHACEWSTAWAAWMVAAMSLVGFYAWWGSRLEHKSTDAATLWMATAGVLSAAVGLVFDLSGEGSSALLLVEQAGLARGGQTSAPWDATAYANLEHTIALATAGAANGLYTLGGILLTVVTPNLPRSVRALMWTTWAAGGAMTLSAVINSVSGMVVSNVILFPSLLMWVAWMAARWRPE